MEGRRVSRHEGKQINYNEKNVALVSTPNWLKTKSRIEDGPEDKENAGPAVGRSSKAVDAKKRQSAPPLPTKPKEKGESSKHRHKSIDPAKEKAPKEKASKETSKPAAKEPARDVKEKPRAAPEPAKAPAPRRAPSRPLADITPPSLRGASRSIPPSPDAEARAHRFEDLEDYDAMYDGGFDDYPAPAPAPAAAPVPLGSKRPSALLPAAAPAPAAKKPRSSGLPPAPQPRVGYEVGASGSLGASRGGAGTAAAPPPPQLPSSDLDRYNYSLPPTGISNTPFKLTTPQPVLSPSRGAGAGGDRSGTSAFLRLQEAYDELQSKYKELQRKKLYDAEHAILEGQERAQRHAEALSALAERWRSEAERQAGLAAKGGELEDENRRLRTQVGDLKAAVLALEAQKTEVELKCEDIERQEVARDATRRQLEEAVEAGVGAVMGELEGARAALERTERERREDRAAFAQLQEAQRAESARLLEARQGEWASRVAALETQVAAAREREGDSLALTMLTGLTAHRTAPGVVRYADASLGFAFELRAPEACTSDAEEEVIEGGKKVEVRKIEEDEVEYRPVTLGSVGPYLSATLKEEVFFPARMMVRIVPMIVEALRDARDEAEGSASEDE